MVGNLLRKRDGSAASVSFSELLFDLIYVFAVTQISHYLLHHLTLVGALQSLVLWFAVWLPWQYTAWVTNWFNPETRQVRLLLFSIMLFGLFLAAAIPDAFGSHGIIFATCYIAIQVGRTLVVLLFLKSDDPIRKNFLRILGWLTISAAFWLTGALSQGELRLALWSTAVLCEYVSPMFGFRLPVLGYSRSHTEWSIEGHHLAERCQLFVIVAFGETLLMTGATLGELKVWELPVVIAVLIAFTGSMVMWWIYFDTSSKAGSHTIARSDNPGKMGSYFHYIHVILVGAIIICAVANETVIAHPAQKITEITRAMLLLGPAIYLIANTIYKRMVYLQTPLSHLAGVVALVILAPFSLSTDLLMVSFLTTVIMIVVAIWESRSSNDKAHLLQH